MFKTKNLTLILIGIMLFSLLLTVVGITLPISRKSDKIEEAGSQSMLSGDAIAIAMGHYSATSLRLLPGVSQRIHRLPQPVRPAGADARALRISRCLYGNTQ